MIEECRFGERARSYGHCVSNCRHGMSQCRHSCPDTIPRRFRASLGIPTGSQSCDLQDGAYLQHCPCTRWLTTNLDIPPTNLLSLHDMHTPILLPWASANIGGIQYYTSGACGMGSTEHVAFLPSEAFGQDNILIRLHPSDDTMAIFPLTWDGETENSHVYSNTTASVLMNIEYIYLRYR